MAVQGEVKILIDCNWLDPVVDVRCWLDGLTVRWKVVRLSHTIMGLPVC